MLNSAFSVNMEYKRKLQLRQLWQACFHDSDDYLDIFFNNVYDPSFAHDVCRDGEVVSALYMLPYLLRLDAGCVLPMQYMCGVSTAEAYRGQGLASDLIRQVLQKETAPLVCLMPAEDSLFDYYSQFGFSPAFFREEVPVETVALSGASGENMSRDEMADFCQREECSRNFSLQHGRNDFEVVIKEHLSSGGLIFSKKGKYCGFAVDTEKGILLKDWFGEFPRPLPVAGLGEKKVFRRQRGHVPYGMVRIVDAFEVLIAFAGIYPQVDRIELTVVDDVIERNNFSVQIVDGKCKKIQKNPTAKVLSVAELADYLFVKQSKVRGLCGGMWMSLMLE